MLSRTKIQPSGSLPGLSALRAGLAIRAGSGSNGATPPASTGSENLTFHYQRVIKRHMNGEINLGKPSSWPALCVFGVARSLWSV